MGKGRKMIDEQKKHRYQFETPHWFELVDASEGKNIQRLERSKSLDLAILEEYRVFVRGRLDDLFWIEVPADMPHEHVQALGETLQAQNVNAMIMSDQIRFVKMRMCSPEEEEVLDEHDKEEKGKIVVPKRSVSGAGSEHQRDGDRGGESGRLSLVREDDQADVEAEDADPPADDS